MNEYYCPEILYMKLTKTEITLQELLHKHKRGGDGNSQQKTTV